MDKKTKKVTNPWTGKTTLVKIDPNECPDCSDDKGAWGTVKSVSNYMSSEAVALSNERLEICKVCPESQDLYGRGWINFCNLCGCMLKVKTRLKSSKCPAGKW
jgi:hypothetical protein